jgi:hypothetical protein
MFSVVYRVARRVLVLVLVLAHFFRQRLDSQALRQSLQVLSNPYSPISDQQPPPPTLPPSHPVS